MHIGRTGEKDTADAAHLGRRIVQSEILFHEKSKWKFKWKFP